MKKLFAIILLTLVAAFLIDNRSHENKLNMAHEVRQNIHSRPSQFETSNKSVLVAAHDIMPGSILSKEDVRSKMVSYNRNLTGEYLDKSSFPSFQDRAMVMQKISAGEIISIAALSKMTKYWNSLTPGMAIHAFKIDVDRGVGAIIRPNMFVRVIYNNGKKLVVIIDHARVIGVKKYNQENPNDLLDDVYVEVTPQMAQLLATEKAEKFTLIPIKYHPAAYTPSQPYSKEDLSNVFINQPPGNSVVKLIKGDKVYYKNLSGDAVSRDALEKKPLSPRYPEFTNSIRSVKPPYRLND